MEQVTAKQAAAIAQLIDLYSEDGYAGITFDVETNHIIGIRLFVRRNYKPIAAYVIFKSGRHYSFNSALITWN